MLPLTVIFTTYNEAPNIVAALQSVMDWVDEIIVVDSFSVDGTLNFLRQYPAVKVHQRAYVGPADQKNWAIPQAKNEWVLLMDADERATSAMRDEITEILRGGKRTQELPKKERENTQNNPNHESPIPQSHNLQSPISKSQNLQSPDCYWIGFTHFFMGKQVRYSGWQNDKTIRLIRRDKCRYNDNRVHEEINTEGLKVGFLTSKFDHYTFRNLAHFVAKQERYAAWSALDYENKTGKITAFHLVFKPFFRFCKHFILKKGFLDGRVGFFIAVVAAWTVFLRYAFMAEKRRKISNNE